MTDIHSNEKQDIDEHLDDPHKVINDLTTGQKDANTTDNPVAYLSPEQKAQALSIAYQTDPGVRWTSRRGLTLLAILASALVCGSDSGFDSGVMSSINTMHPYLDYFGFEEAQKTTGIIFGIYTVGGVSAFFLNTSLPDLLGRRRAMTVCNSVLVVGILLAALSQNLAMFLIGRFLMGFGAISASAAARSYIVEIAPIKNRGMVLGSYNVVQNLGSIFVSGTSIVFGNFTHQWGWRGILLLALYGPVINITCTFFIPESPKWLWARGKTEEATRILTKYHSAHNDVNSPLVHFELLEMREEIANVGAASRWWDLRQLFATRANRYRMMLAAMIGVWGQTLGPATVYFAVLLKVAGIHDTHRQRILNFAYTIVNCAAGLLGAFLMDRLGRRPVTIFGTASAGFFMFIIGGVLSRQTERAYANAGIAMIYLYGWFSQIAWCPINNLYPAEIMSFDIRARGLAFAALCTQAAGLLNTFAVPLALIELNWKTYFIFGAWDVVGVVAFALLMTETRGLPLEMMQDVFEAGNPRRMANALVKANSVKKDQ